MKTYPILVYHGIHDHPTSSGLFDHIYSIRRRDFEEQIAWLKLEGYRSCLISDIVRDVPTDKIVVITFDDGDISNLQVALPILQQHSFVAEFFITTNRIGQPGSLNPDQIKRLSSCGMSVQSHGVTHRYLSDLANDELLEELMQSKASLEKILEKKVVGLSLPGGRGNDRVIAFAKAAGYEYMCTSRFGHDDLQTGSFRLRRITINARTNLDEFRSYVRGQGILYVRSIGRERMLKWAKCALGNRLYERIRQKLLVRAAD
jgi:peptidoglycan/xylan/chitin deacetylase (PgdA/CDA1 family)